MFEPLPSKFEFPQSEKRVLEFWDKHDVFHETVRRRAGSPRFVFYEGPPTANGMPHPGHCLTRVMKDVFPRYKTMCGFLVERKGGWDTHGLPVEREVCKELGIRTKQEIEAYGVEKFNLKCIQSVFRYTREWEEMTRRLAYWVDLKDAYVTFHQSYVESVWWSLKTLFERGVLYQGHKVVWWWAQGGTALSSGEVGEGYKKVDDPSVFVKFPLVDVADSQDVLKAKDDPELNEQLTALIAEYGAGKKGDAVIDFSEAKFVTSASLGRMLDLRKVVTSAGGQLRLRGVGPSLRRLFAAVALDKVFEIESSTASGGSHAGIPKRTSLLVWTTTPWTLISNHFAAVHPDLEYALVHDPETDEHLYIAKDLVEAVTKKVKRELRVVSTCTGTDLVGLRYEPMGRTYYDAATSSKLPELTGMSSQQLMQMTRHYQSSYQKTLGHTRLRNTDGSDGPFIGWRVVRGDFVTVDSGTGVVHVAPAFGEADFDLLRKEREVSAVGSLDFPVLCAVNPDGTFNSDAPERYRGRWVKECDKDIIRELRDERKTPWGTPLLYHQEVYNHDYPFCPQSPDDPLIQYARKSWFVRTSQFKDEFLKNNAAINWLPEHIKEGRFGDFLRNNVDWALSRERYWGTPLPIWVCEKCGKMEAIGSFAELQAKPGATDGGYWDRKVAEHKGQEFPSHLRVHKPYIDEWTYACAACAGSASPATGNKDTREQGNKGGASILPPGAKHISFTHQTGAAQVDFLLRRQPQWEVGVPTYFVTFRMADGGSGAARSSPLNEQERKITLDACLQFNNARINLHTVVVMPDQVHLLMTPLEKRRGTSWSLNEVMQGIKSDAARGIARLRGVAEESVAVWEEQDLDQAIRTDAGFEEKRTQILNTPRTHGLTEPYAWLWDEEGLTSQKSASSNAGEIGKGETRPSDSNKSTMRRVSEVIDCWWDAGSMPFAQWGFPHAEGSIQKFADRFPADFISEAIDQTRGWFYGLLAISTLLFNSKDAPKNLITGGSYVTPGAADSIVMHTGGAIAHYRFAEQSHYPLPFRTCIVLGHIAGEDGNKMSKKLRNYKEPTYIFDTLGADAMRWYFLSAQAPWTSTRFAEAAIRDSQREFLVKLYNVLSFFTIYAKIDGFDPSKVGDIHFAAADDPRAVGGPAGPKTNPMHWRPTGQRTELDRWIVTELRNTVAAVRESMDRFENYPAAQELNNFVDALSNWYVRRSRDRFWRPLEGGKVGKSEGGKGAIPSHVPTFPPAHSASSAADQEKFDAYHTLYGCLRVLSHLIAPFTPFFAEKMHEILRMPDDPISIHMCDYPTVDDIRFHDAALATTMNTVRELVALGRAARTAAKLKVRQPLSLVEIILAPSIDAKAILDHAGLVTEELNVKRVELAADADKYVTYKVVPNFKAIGSKFRAQVPGIKDALGKLPDAAAARRSLLETGGLPLTLADGATVALSPEEVEIRLDAKPGWAASQGKAGVVVLSTEVTPELRDEGVVRELIHFVQAARKEQNLAYEARIALHLEGPAEFQAIVQRFEETIKSECLVTRIVFGPSPAGTTSQEIDVEGYKVAMAITK